VDPDDLDDMMIDLTYETHGLVVTYAPTSGDAASDDILVCLHQPADTERDFGPAFRDLEIAEKAIHVLVRKSQIAQPAVEDTLTFPSGPLNAKAFRLGQDPVAHDAAGREWRLALQSLT